MARSNPNYKNNSYLHQVQRLNYSTDSATANYITEIVCPTSVNANPNSESQYPYITCCSGENIITQPDLVDEYCSSTQSTNPNCNSPDGNNNYSVSETAAMAMAMAMDSFSSNKYNCSISCSCNPWANLIEPNKENCVNETETPCTPPRSPSSSGSPASIRRSNADLHHRHRHRLQLPAAPRKPKAKSRRKLNLRNITFFTSPEIELFFASAASDKP